jgi:hypothetical protein
VIGRWRSADGYSSGSFLAMWRASSHAAIATTMPMAKPISRR